MKQQYKSLDDIQEFDELEQMYNLHGYECYEYDDENPRELDFGGIDEEL